MTYNREKAAAFAVGLGWALPHVAGIHAEHDCICVFVKDMPEDEIARVVALERGWHDGRNEDGDVSADEDDDRYLGFFT